MNLMKMLLRRFVILLTLLASLASWGLLLGTGVLCLRAFGLKLFVSLSLHWLLVCMAFCFLVVLAIVLALLFLLENPVVHAEFGETVEI